MAIKPSAGRNDVTHDHIFLKAVKGVLLAKGGRFGQHAGGVLEGRRGQEALGFHRSFSNAQQHWTRLSRLTTHLFNALVLNFERKLVDLLTPQERGVASLRDTHLTKHLAYDHFDVLIINRHTLKAVHLLNLIHKKCLQLLWSENIQYIMR